MFAPQYPEALSSWYGSSLGSGVDSAVSWLTELGSSAGFVDLDTNHWTGGLHQTQS